MVRLIDAMRKAADKQASNAGKLGVQLTLAVDPVGRAYRKRLERLSKPFSLSASAPARKA